MTTQDTGSKVERLAAHIVSDIFSPLLIPTYTMMVALWLTMMCYLPLIVRLKVLAGIFAISALIPFVFILAMLRMGKVTDMGIRVRQHRPLPYLVAMLCYVGAAIYLATMRAPIWLPVSYIGAAAVTLCTLLINFRWKISAHTGAAGAFAAGIYWLAYQGLLFNLLFWVCGAFLAVGLLGWARLSLERHTTWQVFAGAMLGFVVMFGTLNLFV